MRNPINKIDQLPISADFKKELDSLSKENRMLNCWLSSTPLNPIPLLVIQLSDIEEAYLYRNEQWTVNCLRKENTHISFFNTDELLEHEILGTLFLDIHCQESNLYYSTTPFEFSQYRSQENHKLFVEKYKALDSHVRDYLENPSINYFNGAGYYTYRSLEFYVDYMELLLLGFKYSNDDLHLTERWDNLEMIVPYLKTFFLIDEEKEKYLIGVMVADLEADISFKENWSETSLELLEKCSKIVSLIISNLKTEENESQKQLLIPPTPNSNIKELNEMVKILSTNESVMELYHFHTKTFIDCGVTKHQYFIIIITPHDYTNPITAINTLLSKCNNANQEFFAVIDTNLRIQDNKNNNCYFFKPKLISNNYFYKRNIYSSGVHFENSYEKEFNNLKSYQKDVKRLLKKLSIKHILRGEDIPLKIRVQNSDFRYLLNSIMQAIVYKETSYQRDGNFSKFLGLALYCDDTFTHKWHRIHETIDLYKICTTDEEFYVDQETATKILTFFQELYDELLVQ